tara:strand:- start:1633 stop:2328 length:696 start_codon:yes stop_codon:yes gene_type:complete
MLGTIRSHRPHSDGDPQSGNKTEQRYLDAIEKWCWKTAEEEGIIEANVHEAVRRREHAQRMDHIQFLKFLKEKAEVLNSRDKRRQAWKAANEEQSSFMTRKWEAISGRKFKNEDDRRRYLRGYRDGYSNGQLVLKRLLPTKVLKAHKIYPGEALGIAECAAAVPGYEDDGNEEGLTKYEPEVYFAFHRCAPWREPFGRDDEDKWFCETCHDLTSDYPCAKCGKTAGFDSGI